MLSKYCGLSSAGYIALITSVITAGSLSGEEVWPEQKWPKAAPETVGISSPKLDTYISWLSSKAEGEPFGTIVIRYGKIAVEYYGDGADASSKWEIGSIRKAVGSALLGIAIEEGRLSLETKVYDVWPEILQTGKDREIEVKHLFESTSGWKRSEAPGTEWVYNNAAFTAGGTVLGRVYQLPEDKIGPLAKRRIADRIGASSWRCYHYPGDFSTGAGNPGPKLAIDSNMRDLARFGYLWLRKGRWNGEQIIPESYVVEATRNQVAHLNRHYGFCWFVNDGRKLLPNAPEDAYFHVGNGRDDRRTVLMVIPSLDLIAAVGVHAAKYDITSGYRSEPVENVDEWISKITAGVYDTQIDADTRGER